MKNITKPLTTRQVSNITQTFSYLEPGFVLPDITYIKGIYSDEFEVARLLSRTLGGHIAPLGELRISGNPDPDFLWRDKLWELKKPKCIKRVLRRLHKAVYQIRENPGGIVLDITHINDDLDFLLSKVSLLLLEQETPVIDVIIIKNNTLIKILSNK